MPRPAPVEAASGEPFRLVWPALDYLDGVRAALARGWSPNTVHDTSRRELERIDADPVAWVDGQVDREAKGPPIEDADGTLLARLPGFTRWMWDGEFCGSIGLRWQKGTTDLPPTCLGHVGYAVVPWKRGRGYATRALRALLDDVRAEGLPHVVVTTDPDNVASRRVIEANGGTLVERFIKPASHGGGQGLRYRIDLDAAR